MTIFTTLMKKFFLTIMAFVYLAAASGVSINMHYCMDQLVSLGMTGDHAKNCPVCNQEKKTSTKAALSCNGCCKDELKQIKLEKDHKAEQNILPKFSFVEIVHTFSANEYTPIIPFKLVGSYNINAPPESPKVPTFLFNCVFRI